eukprot:20331_1
MPLRNMHSEVLTQQIIDTDILEHLQQKPEWSIFTGPILDDTLVDSCISSLEPLIPTSTTLHLSSHHCVRNPAICDGKHIDSNAHTSLNVNYFNFIADYEGFASQCKINLTFYLSIHSTSSVNKGPSFNILVKPVSNKSAFASTDCSANDIIFNERNLYSKLLSIHLISTCKKQYKWIYKVHVLLAVTKALTKIRKHIKVAVCVNYNEQCHQSVSIIPITYFSLLKHLFIGTIYDLFGITILNDLYSLIMHYSGTLHWCLGEAFICDTLDMDKVNPIAMNIEHIDKGVNPKIKNVYCVASMDRRIVQTRFIGMNVLIYNTERDKLETIREPMDSYTDVLCLRYKQFMEDDAKYNSDNNVILAKCIALGMKSTKILKNASGKLDFMLWVEWKDCISWTDAISKRSFDSSLSNLIEWYEMKRTVKENEIKTLQRDRFEAVKRQRQNRQRYKKHNDAFHRKHSHKHKRHLYNRW